MLLQPDRRLDCDLQLRFLLGLVCGRSCGHLVGYGANSFDVLLIHVTSGLRTLSR